MGCASTKPTRTAVTPYVAPPLSPRRKREPVSAALAPRDTRPSAAQGERTNLSSSLKRKKARPPNAARDTGGKDRKSLRQERVANSMSTTARTRWQAAGTKVRAVTSFVLGGKRHTASEYTSIVLQKAQPRRGSVADTVLTVVQQLEAEVATLKNDKETLKRRVAALEATGQNLRQRKEGLEQRFTSLDAAQSALQQCRAHKSRLQEHLDLWHSAFRKQHFIYTPSADDKPAPVLRAEAQLKETLKLEGELMCSMQHRLDMDEAAGGEPIVKHADVGGRWHEQQFRWTCCDNRDPDSENCCSCGRKWHLKPGWHRECRKTRGHRRESQCRRDIDALQAEFADLGLESADCKSDATRSGIGISTVAGTTVALDSADFDTEAVAKELGL